MAQVRKYDKGTTGGGITAEPDLFEWEGVGKYERKPMVQTLTRNLNYYADQLGLTGDRRTRFLDNGAKAIKALESGQLRRLANGAYEDTSGSGMSSTGKYDKNWLGKMKDTDNNSYNDIAGYFNTYLDKASIYDPEKLKKEKEKEEDKKKTKFSGDLFLKTGLAEKLYAGDFNANNWFDHKSDQERYNAIAEYLKNADYSSIYNKYLWDNTGITSAEDLRTRANAFVQKLRTGALDNDDYNTAAALGINLDTFLKKPQETPKEPTLDEKIKAEKEAYIKQKKEEGLTDAEAEESWQLAQNAKHRTAQEALQQQRGVQTQADMESEFAQWYNQNYTSGDDYNWAPKVMYNPKLNTVNDKAAAKVIAEDLNGNMKVYVDQVGQWMADRLHSPYRDNKVWGKVKQQPISNYMLYRLGYAWRNGRAYFGNEVAPDEYIIPGTLNEKQYTTYIYNPREQSYKKVSLLHDEKYKDLVKGIWAKNKKTAKKAEGGTLKLQQGGYTAYDDYLRSVTEGGDLANLQNQEFMSTLDQQEKAERQVKQQVDPLKPRDYIRTAEQREAGKRQIGANPAGEYKWTTADKVRLATIGADVASTIAAWVPGYGTAASAVLGVGSTLGNFGADMADKSVSTGQMFANLGIGLGMDLVGLIPGLGTVGKAGKIVKMIKPLSPYIIGGLRVIGTTQALNSVDAIRKLMSTPDKMTLDDWRDVAGGIQAIMGISNYNAGKRMLKRNTSSRQVVDIDGMDRKTYTISQEDYNRIKSAQGKEAQDKLFKEITGSKSGMDGEIKGNKKVKWLGWKIPGTGSDPGKVRTQYDWKEMPEAPWLNRKYNKGDEGYMRYFKGLDQSETQAVRPRRVSSKSSKNTTEPIEHNPWGLYEGTRGKIPGQKNFVRTKELTANEIAKINQNRKLSNPDLSEQEIAKINRSRQAKGQQALTEQEINQINAQRAAKRAPLTQQEINAINTRAKNNAPTKPLSREERIQQMKYNKEHSLEAELARARQELAEADARLAQRHNNMLPVPYTRDFIRTGSGPVISPSRPVKQPALLPQGTAPITSPARMLPAPRRITLVNKPEPINANTIDRNLGISPRTKSGAIAGYPNRDSRQADLEAVFGRSAIAKKAAATRAKNKEARMAKIRENLEERRQKVQEKEYNTKRGRQKALKEVFNSKEGIAQQEKANQIIAERSRKKAAQQTVSKANNRIKQEAVKRQKAQKKANNKANRQQQQLTKNLQKNLGYLKEGGNIPKFQNPSGPIQFSTDPYYGITWNTQRMAWVRDKDGKLNVVPRTEYAVTTNGVRYKPAFDATEIEQLPIYKAFDSALKTDDQLATDWLSDAYMFRADANDSRLSQFYDTAADTWNLPEARKVLFEGEAYGNNKPGRADQKAEVLHDINKGSNYYILDGDTKKFYKNIPEGYRATNQSYDSDYGLLTHVLLEKIQDTGKDKKGTQFLAGEKTGKDKKDWNLRPEDIIAFNRMAMGLAANARAAKQAKAGLKPLITDAPWRTHQLEYDYLGDMAAVDAKNKMASLAARTRTASGHDQFAGQLEAEDRGNQYVLNQKQKSANRFYKTKEQIQDDANWNLAAAIENSNYNKGRMLQTDAAKSQIDSALTTAQYAQVLAPYLGGIENTYRQAGAIMKQADASAYQRALLAQMQADYDAAYKAGDQEKIRTITDDYYRKLAAYNRRVNSNPWLIQKTESLPGSNKLDIVMYNKQGGRLTAREREVLQRAKDFNKRMLEDNKQFHKDIMESKKEHNKLIAGMSNLTADLIKNGMKWK